MAAAAPQNVMANLPARLDYAARTILPFFQQLLKPGYHLRYAVDDTSISVFIETPNEEDAITSKMQYGPGYILSPINNDNDDTLHAHLMWVSSSIGQMTGSFLVGIQIFIAYHMGVTEITLENMANDPSRAAQGIYRLLLPNQRRIPLENRATEMSAMLHQSEGAMYRTIQHPAFYQDIQNYIAWVQQGINHLPGNDHPWQVGGAPKRKKNQNNNVITQPFSNATPVLENVTQAIDHAMNTIYRPTRVTPPPPPRSNRIGTPITPPPVRSRIMYPSPTDPRFKLSPESSGNQPANNDFTSNIQAGRIQFYPASPANSIQLAQPSRINGIHTIQTPSPPPRRRRTTRPSSSSSDLLMSPHGPTYSLSSASPAPYSSSSSSFSSELYQPPDPRFMLSPDSKKGGTAPSRRKKSSMHIETSSAMRHRPRRRTYRARKSRVHRRTRRRGGACGSCMLGSMPSQ